jgi:SpoVK/Ycf46/Vps4 family AAA+-type ATPase
MRAMAEGRLLRQLMQAGVTSNTEEFRRAAEEVIREERARKHHLLANDLERILYGETRGGPKQPSLDVPRDRERSLPLLEVRQGVRDLGDIVLRPDNRAVVDQVLLEQGRTDVLQTFGLRPLSRILLCGPPGSGKTLLAEVLASELGLPFAVVRFDAIVSSLLGETAANLRRVFDFLEKERVVALFDEFDGIAKERDDPSEHGELKRVVNAFLQMIDGYRGKSLMLAATNHERLVDRALWRRFEEVMVLGPPSHEHVAEFIAIKLRGVRADLPTGDQEFLSSFDGFSFADIERVFIRAIKAMVLRNQEFLTRRHVEESTHHERQRLRAFPSSG